MAYYAGFSGVPKWASAETLNPTAIPGRSTQVETFTVTGLRAEIHGIIHVFAPSLEAGIIVQNARISANDTLEITFKNETDASVNPASQSFYVIGL